MKRSKSSLLLVAVVLCGCEPLRGIASEKDIQGGADIRCVDSTLRRTFSSIERDDYISDGGTFPKGTHVVQFTYYKTDDARGRAQLEFGGLNDKTRVQNSFTGIGSELPQQFFPPAMRAMQIAANSLKASCKLDLSGMKLNAVGQRVDALR